MTDDLIARLRLTQRSWEGLKIAGDAGKGLAAEAKEAADTLERYKAALERIALSGDGEDVFERSTLYSTFQLIARKTLNGEPS